MGHGACVYKCACKCACKCVCRCVCKCVCQCVCTCVCKCVCKCAWARMGDGRWEGGGGMRELWVAMAAAE